MFILCTLRACGKKAFCDLEQTGVTDIIPLAKQSDTTA